ncbi:hypothetical protein VT84_14145 [Gemmata sp. SH-PL17]|uniref:hypothetical protein n=1 Tax=Gemmata sp. SH-PL17 TaxID=1630693 RepID=UPI00078CD942|nr:hypothetical protein [Gemmata sp. SH-PL17]AMV25535.1 hypothetical protein VT84_14145 [Gemmata sp. SH-PL17]
MRPLSLALALSAATVLFSTGRAGAAFTVTSPDPLPSIGYLSDLLDNTSVVLGPLPVPSGGFTTTQAVVFPEITIVSDYVTPKTSLILYDLYAVNGTTPDVFIATYSYTVTNEKGDGTLRTDITLPSAATFLSPSLLNPTLDVGTPSLTFYLTNFRETDVPQPTPAPAGLVLVASAVPFAALLRRKKQLVTG